MTLSNKISSIFPYLDGVYFGTDEGQVKVGSAKFDIFSRSLQMVYQLGDVVGCFLLWRLQPIFLFVSRPDRFSSTLCIAGEGLQACVAWVFL